MSYYRLRDIQTPPFAYAINKDEAVRTCPACQMPHEELSRLLEIAICLAGAPRSYSVGGAMMADHWLIGDEVFAAKLERALPGQFLHRPVTIAAWQEGSEGASPALVNPPGAAGLALGYYYFWPRQKLELDPRPRGPFAPRPCRGCGREIPEIPFETEPLPALNGRSPSVASVKDFHFEGYDYLFHGDALVSLGPLATKMILEPLVSEIPLLREMG